MIEIPINRISESPTNPRKTFVGAHLEELAESIREKGVLSPVLVRPHGDGYQLVFGHRRFRAAQIAQLRTIPAMVRELDDVQVLEAQVIENAQRADVHPLEEADAFRDLHEKHGFMVDDIALRLGKSKAYVYGRLRLCSLIEKAREGFLEEKLSLSVALVIARLPTREQQEEATRQLLHFGGTSLAEAKRVTLAMTMHLADAPFDHAAVGLVAGVGACTSCPKRSAAQRALFDDVGDDRCLDQACYRAKADATWAHRKKAAEAKGLRVLTDDEARSVFAYGGEQVASWASYVELDAPAQPGQIDGPTWREKLGNPPPALVRTASGKVIEVAPKPSHSATAPIRDDAEWKREQAEREAERKVREEVKRIAEEKLATAVAFALAATDARVLRLVAVNELEASGLDIDEAVALAEELGAEKEAAEHVKQDFLIAHIADVSQERLAKLVAQMLTGRLWWGGPIDGPASPVALACADFGVDLKKAEATAKRKLKKDAAKAGAGGAA